MNRAAQLRRAVLSSIPDNVLETRVEPRFIATPHRHLKALDPARPIVLGDRGTGKSFWWETLASPLGGPFVDALYPGPRTVVRTAFGAKALELNGRWPDADTIAAIVRKTGDRAVWKAMIVEAAAPTFFHGIELWSARAQLVHDEPEKVWAALVMGDNELHARQERLLVIFDALDRAGSTWTEIVAAHRGLCMVLLELQGMRAIRAKAFIRPDIFGEGDVLRFPDASKLRSSAAELVWEASELYGLAFQYMANADTSGEAFRSLDAEWVHSEIVNGYVNHSLGDEARQKAIWHKLAGPWMGANATRGDTYRWLPNHLSDARGRATPRSFLAAVRAAAAATAPGDDLALPPRSIQVGVREAAKIRQREIVEDFPWTQGALSLLDGTLVPCKERDVLSRWRKAELRAQLDADLGGRRRRRHESDLGGVLEDLVDLGLVQRLPDGRINIPDVVRLGFGIGRRGGVPRR